MLTIENVGYNSANCRNDDDSHDSGTGRRRQVSTIREYTYIDFLKCQPLNFKGTEGAVGQVCNGYSLRKCLDMVGLTRPGEKKPYEGSKPLCPKCNYRHDGQYAPKCTNCKRIGHSARDCKSQLAATNNQRAQGENQRVLTCFECRAQGHFRSNCPKLKNENLGNQARNGNAIARAYDVGTIGTNPNSNVITCAFLLNNHYALILFNTGADKSFVSTAFSSLIDIIPTTLDHGYNVELADGRIIWVNTLIQGCTLNFLNHPFNIDLMPVEMSSFDVIIGMNCMKKAEEKSKKQLEDVPIVQDFLRRKPLEFQVGDRVMLKVSPWKGVIRFRKWGKLNSRYIGPFKVLVKVGAIAYRLELSQQLSRVHNTFHVSNLKECLSDEPLVILLDEIHIDDKLYFVKEPVEIIDREVKRIKKSRIPIIRVRWKSRRGLEFTWEREDQIQKKYPHLFTNTAPSTSAAS
uniref:Putative reverse transcriptase domain-containing protein n=1 Tax=Tanacetum cinerariifolium TaxID=118510 RepID=A0A6L2NAP2_TANCI|nr:putative reverse transcriptase domain-containing protein [Tanacetum cinerariifolium]